LCVKKVVRPRLALSGCLGGEEVRYDGGHKLDRYVMDRLGVHVTWQTLCPEVEAGFGVPRPPVRLERVGGQVRVLDIRSRGDRTDPLDMASRHLARGAAEWDGAVLKARSPSCGTSVSLWQGERETDGRAPGRFASLLLAAGLPMIDEERLAEPRARTDFLVRVFTRARWRESDDVAEFHARHAPLFQGLDPFAVRRLATAAERSRGAYQVALFPLLADPAHRFARSGDEEDFPYPQALDRE
jgi:uncharacterized protein YbbK (DUF523 family)